MTENIQITTEVDRRNPKICRFTSARTLYVGTKTVSNADDAKGLPLAEKLICLSGVEKIQLIGHLLVVAKTADREWKDLDKEIESVLISYLISSEALTPDEAHEKMMLIGRNTREKVQYLVDTQINPGVAEDGAPRKGEHVTDDTAYPKLNDGYTESMH